MALGAAAAEESARLGGMAAAADAVAQWNPEAVIASAKHLIHSSNYEKVGEARATVESFVADWVRVVTTDASVQGDAALKQRAEHAIITLWSLYAGLEIELRQFKQATKVFESGANCPVAGTRAVFWLQYAAFCIDRKKFSNARKVFVRALRTVPENEHGDLWTRFHTFVNEQLDPSMSLETLQGQVFPEKAGAPAEPRQEEPQQLHDQSQTQHESQPQTLDQPSSSVAAPVAASSQPQSDTAGAAAAPAVDPALAFVDTKGNTEAVAAEAGAGAKRKLSDAQQSASPAKQLKADSSTVGPAVATDDADVKSFLQIPTTLPVTPGCPHLLFDKMEIQKTLDNELLERLSTVLSDNAVFQGVKDLYENQRQRDRDMLYRWQDLVGMQMKEGSELFARHADVEKGVTEPRELIELKAKHLEQRREFVSRCQMSQQQFIDICEMDRVGALKAQQISLENMKIPEMKVTTDADTIDLQRAILALILEAEKLSREEATKTKEHARAPKKAGSPFVQKGGHGRGRSDSRDRESHSRGGHRGGRGGFGRGGGSHGRGDRFRRPHSPPRGGRGPPKRHDGYAPQLAAGARPYDNHAPRQTHSYGSGQRPRNQGPPPERGFGDFPARDRQVHYDRGQDRRQHGGSGPSQDWGAGPQRFADPRGAPGAPGGGIRFSSPDPYGGPGPQMGPHGGGGAPVAHVQPDYGRGNQYGPPQHAGAFQAPPSRYGSEPTGPPQQQFSAPPTSYDYPPSSAPYGYPSHPQPQQHVQYGQPPPAYQQPPTQQLHQQPHVQPQHGYGAPAPYQPQQHHAPPPHQQQQFHRPQYQTNPQRNGGGGGGYDRYRRGGGGGGRYGRR